MRADAITAVAGQRERERERGRREGRDGAAGRETHDSRGSGSQKRRRRRPELRRQRRASAPAATAAEIIIQRQLLSRVLRPKASEHESQSHSRSPALIACLYPLSSCCYADAPLQVSLVSDEHRRRCIHLRLGCHIPSLVSTCVVISITCILLNLASPAASLLGRGSRAGLSRPRDDSCCCNEQAIRGEAVASLPHSPSLRSVFQLSACERLVCEGARGCSLFRNASDASQRQRQVSLSLSCNTNPFLGETWSLNDADCVSMTAVDVCSRSSPVSLTLSQVRESRLSSRFPRKSFARRKAREDERENERRRRFPYHQ